MSVHVSSWLRQAAAYLSAGIVGTRGYKRRPRRQHNIAASPGLSFAAENLEHRQLLAGADVSVISAAGDPGNTVEVPVKVTNWDNPQPGDKLTSFKVFVEYETTALDLAATDVSLGTFFTQAGWTFSADVQDDAGPRGGFVAVTANSPTNQPTSIPDSLPNLVQFSFSISPGATAGAARVDLLLDPFDETAIYSTGGALTLKVFSGEVTVGGGGDGGGPGDGGPGDGGPGDGGPGDGGPGDGGPGDGGPGDGGPGGGGPGDPVAMDDSGVAGFSTNEDTPFITGSVLANDTDPENSPLEVYTFSQPSRGLGAGGSIESRNDGTFVFDPEEAFADLTDGQSGFAVFVYSVKNQFDNVSNEAMVQIEVFGVNDTPSISSIANQSMLEDGVLSNLGFTVSDPDDSTLEVQVSSNDPTLFPSGSLSLSGSGNNRLISVTPAANLSGQATITLTVSDGVTSSSTSFVVTVQAVNDAPVISDITGQSTNEDTPILNIPFTVADIDSGNLTLSVSGTSDIITPAGIEFSGSGNNRFLSIHPEQNRSGQATLTVTVSDGEFSDSTTFDVFVNAVNDPPFISTVDNQTTDEDVPITGAQVTLFDVDSEFSITSSSTNPLLLPTGSVVVVGSGQFRTITITPAANVSGNADVTLTVNDGQASRSTTFSVVVNAVNDAPVISEISNQTVLEDGVLSNVPFTIVDPEDDGVSLSLSTSNATLLPLSGIVLSGSGSNRQLSITPAPGLSGSVTVTVSATDGIATSSRQFTVNVTPVNDAPTISSIDAQTVDEDGTLSGIPFTISDEDSFSLTLTASSNNTALLPPGSLIITGTGANRQLFVTPAANGFGTATVTVTVSDGLASATSTFNLTVTAFNDAPVANPDSASISVSSQSSVVVSVLSNDSDIDGTLIPETVQIVIPPTSGIAVSNADGTITYTPGADSSGIVTFSYRVSDNSEAFSAAATVSVNVIRNAAPVIPSIPAQSLAVGGAGLQIPLSITDADGDPLQVTVSADVAGFLSTLSFVGTGTSRVLQIAPGTRPGLTRVTVTTSDGVNSPVTRTFDVSVGLLIDAGAARPVGGVMTHRGYANSVALPFSTSATVTGAPAGIPATLFRTNVFDNPGRPELLFSIPTVPNQAYEVDLFFAEIWTGAFGVGRRVFDVMIEGSLALDNLDVFAVAGGGNRALTRTFQVTGDGNLSIELQRVTQNPNISGIRVRPLANPNTAPTITPVTTQQTNEDTPITGIEFAVADAESQPLTVTVSSNNTELLPSAGLVLSGTGGNRQLSITPAPNRSGTAQVTLSVSDGQATTDRVFTVNVTSVNDAPVAVADSAVTRVGTAVTIPVLTNDSDIDGTLDVGSVAITTQSPNGTAVPNTNGTVSFTPNPGFSGTAEFQYTVRDNEGGQSQPATVTVLVRNNASPVISEIAAIQLNVGTSSAPIPFQVTDSDGDSLVVVVTTADSGIARTPTITGIGSNRQLTVTAGDLVGMTTITITVTDNVNAPVTRTVTVSAFALIDAGASKPTPGALPENAFQNGAGLRFNGTSPVTTAAGSLAASVPDLFYRSTIFDPPGGKELGFDINARSGQMFAVDLFFAEVWGGAFGQGKRVFDVNIDGETVLNDFDVFKEAGGGNIGIARRFVIQSDGRIDIDLQRVIQNPMLSGLRVTPLGNS